MLSFLVAIARHPQSNQNNKFAKPLQYLKKELRNDVDFLPADKHQDFLQVTQLTFTCLKLIETLEKGVKYVQS